MVEEEVLGRGFALVRNGMIYCDPCGNFLISKRNDWVEGHLAVKVRIVKDE